MIDGRQLLYQTFRIVFSKQSQRFLPLKMAKMLVSKLNYYLLSAIFHSLCLGGLVWQVTQISLNFFQFDTMKDIKVSMPEATNHSGRHLNFCFDNHQFFDYELYSQMLDNGTIAPGNIWKFDRANENSKRLLFEFMTISQRFKLRHNLRKIESFWFHPEEYILGNSYCYQLSEERYVFSSFALANVTRMKVSLSDKLPNVDYTRFQFIDNVTRTGQDIFILSSYYYFVQRLPWPYIDDCFDYGTINFPSRLHALGHCQKLDNRKQFQNQYKNKLYWTESVRPNDTKLANFTAPGDIGTWSFQALNEECLRSGMYQKFDCKQKTYFIEFNRKTEMADQNWKKIIIETDQNSNPSFDIESKPRIDHIDFLTYTRLPKKPNAKILFWFFGFHFYSIIVTFMLFLVIYAT